MKIGFGWDGVGFSRKGGVSVYFKRRSVDGADGIIMRLTGIKHINVQIFRSLVRFRSHKDVHPNNGPYGWFFVGPFCLEWHGSNRRRV